MRELLCLRVPLVIKDVAKFLKIVRCDGTATLHFGMHRVLGHRLERIKGLTQRSRRPFVKAPLAELGFLGRLTATPGHAELQRRSQSLIRMFANGHRSARLPAPPPWLTW